jgi:predicted acyltransferase
MTSDNAPEQTPSFSIPERIVAIDALRGFDMFWIVGAGALVKALAPISDTGVVEGLKNQLTHVEWDGCRFYDLIFPLFVFLMGASSVFSLARLVETEGRGAAYRRVFQRAALIYFLGLLYSGASSHDGGPEMFRFVGVLQRIAICYLAGSLLFLNFRLRGLVTIAVSVLVGYWALLKFAPVPEIGAGVLTPTGNFAAYIDRLYLPGFKYDGDFDPEGLLSMFPAVVTGLLGIFAGMLFRNPEIEPRKRVAWLAAAGVLGVATGWLWSFDFPLIKKIWTSSYVLYAGGWSALLLALFYLVIDVGKIDRWAHPFVWIGMNPITIYMVAELIGYGGTVRRLVHRPVVDALEPYGELLVASLSLGLAFALARFLYRRKIFLRV